MLPSLMKVFSELIWIISLWVSFTALYVIEPQVCPATDVSVPEPQTVSPQKEERFKEVETEVVFGSNVMSVTTA
ncbi:MAG: hypothetical protein MK510_14535, partial [SAR324 cluster bacterium]|nr:hypothetical protein [SAR324 cluster bacterium]